jgi:hypothetical protein
LKALLLYNTLHAPVQVLHNITGSSIPGVTHGLRYSGQLLHNFFMLIKTSVPGSGTAFASLHVCRGSTILCFAQLCKLLDAVAVHMQTRHAGSRILNINTAQEEEFVRLNLLYAGFFGETYT